MGWFPYLFYSTTYVAEVMRNELGHAPDIDEATRAGSLALLIYSFGESSHVLPYTTSKLTDVVAIIAGTLLPYLAARDRRLLKPTGHKTTSQVDEDDSDEEEDVEMDKIREMVRGWKAEAARHGRPLKLPTSESIMWTLLKFSAIHA
jgi:solute carrier family 45 protein 1/2/4